MLRIMIVDDMDIIRIQMKRLKLWGEETGFIIAEEAKNGHDALLKLENTPVDLIITDIRMPKVDGLELLKAVMEKKLCPCVVLVSDYTEFSYARQGLVLGAFDYMVKPVEEESLLALLNRAKDFILSKKGEQEKLKLIEQGSIEQLEGYVWDAELKQLVELMKSGNPKALQYAEHIMDITYAKLNQDLLKTEKQINILIYHMASKMLETYKWLDKFLIMKDLEAPDTAVPADLVWIKASFAAAVERILVLLSRLQPDRNENAIAYQMCKCVLENIDEDISLKNVSELIFMNKSYISEVFKQKIGLSFTEYTTIVKMERAKKLMADGRLKGYEIAETLGFKDIEYFGKLFKKYTGQSPTEYKQVLVKK